jgi:hypothetical protein
MEEAPAAPAAAATLSSTPEGVETTPTNSALHLRFDWAPMHGESIYACEQDADDQYLRHHVHFAGEVNDEGAVVVLLLPLHHALCACEHDVAALRSQVGLPAIQVLLQSVVDAGPRSQHEDAASTHGVVTFLAAVATRRPAACHSATGHGLDWGTELGFQDLGNVPAAT